MLNEPEPLILAYVVACNGEILTIWRTLEHAKKYVERRDFIVTDWIGADDVRALTDRGKVYEISQRLLQRF